MKWFSASETFCGNFFFKCFVGQCKKLVYPIMVFFPGRFVGCLSMRATCSALAVFQHQPAMLVHGCTQNYRSDNCRNKLRTKVFESGAASICLALTMWVPAKLANFTSTLSSSTQLTTFPWRNVPSSLIITLLSAGSVASVGKGRVSVFAVVAIVLGFSKMKYAQTKRADKRDTVSVHVFETKQLLVYAIVFLESFLFCMRSLELSRYLLTLFPTMTTPEKSFLFFFWNVRWNFKAWQIKARVHAKKITFN